MKGNRGAKVEPKVTAESTHKKNTEGRKEFSGQFSKGNHSLHYTQVHIN